MRRPQLSPNTLYVHEATLYAKENGLDDRFHHVAASAYWEESVDLGSIEVVRGLAESAGLDWSELGPRLESGHYRDEVVESNETARASGIGGTPTYLIGGWRKFGDLSVDELKKSLRLWANRSAAAAECLRKPAYSSPARGPSGSLLPWSFEAEDTPLRSLIPARFRTRCGLE